MQSCVGRLERVEFSAFATPLFRHLPSDVLPEVPEDRNVRAGDVVGDRDARELYDPALDGVHQREVRHRPGKERALGIAGAAQKKRRRREVDDAREADLALDRFQAVDPQPGGFLVLLGLLLVLARDVFCSAASPGFSR